MFKSKLMNYSDYINHWNDMLHNSPQNKRNIRTQKEIVKEWDERGKAFVKRAFDSDRQKKREETINILEKDGVLQNGMEILDIGAGPGTYTIPLSKYADKIYALEPSAVMSSLLKDNLKEHRCTNVEIHNIEWEEVNLEKKEWNKKFDFSFASMCPGISKPKEFLKFIDSSKKWCFFSAFGGEHYEKGADDVWQIFFPFEKPYNTFDIFLPFSLIYSMGYRPKLWFSKQLIHQDYSIDDAVKYFKQFMWRYIECSTDEVEEIRKYVVEKSCNGKYNFKRSICQGMMYWEV